MNPDALDPLKIRVEPWFMDHRIQGRVVLPAVIALHKMSGIAGPDKTEIRDARFLRFLDIPELAEDQDAFIDALVERRFLDKNRVLASLLTRKSGKFPRKLTHVIATFTDGSDRFVIPPELVAAPEGPGIEVPIEDLYDWSVPFGPAFQNVKSPVFITPGGAVAPVGCPDGVEKGESPLGCPFALDAAFHLCSAWCQRYLGVSAVPVGFEVRQVQRPVARGDVVWARVVPRRSLLEAAGLPVSVASGLSDTDAPGFDCWLTDPDGNVKEVCLGVDMRDVSRGQIKVPKWIRASDAARGFDDLKPGLLDLVVMELGAVTPVAEASLTAWEAQRMQELGQKRAHSFLGTRVAVKTMARRILGPGIKGPIQTLGPDRIRPVITDTDIRVSASHDSRFVFVAASRSCLGVDVEEVTDKALRGSRLFLSDDERALVADSREIATRMWTIKESVTKLTGWTLAQAWSRVRIVRTSASESEVLFDGQSSTARHCVVENHVFTVLLKEGEGGC